MDAENALDLLDEDDDLEVVEIIEFGLPRQIYNRNSYFESLDDVAFCRRFRLSRVCVLNLLEIIEYELEYPTIDKNNSVSPMNQLLTCLRLYSTGGHLQQVADFMGMHLSTVSRIVKRVSEAVARLYARFICFPNENGVIMEAQQKFFNIAAFPKVLGAIDGTHIKIQSPGGNDAEVFRNRKQYFSINTQMICDSNLKIMNVVARWPGSAHDSTIFTHSNIKNDFENNRYPNCLLLGDSGYANNRFLLTPLLHPRTVAEQLYNESHIRTRNVIERCFGVLKRRFPILAYGCRLRIDRVLTIIVAVSVLHNICLVMNDVDVPPAPQEINEQDLENRILEGQMPVLHGDVPIHQDNQLRVGTRELLIQEYFARM